MITNSETNFVYFSERLSKRYPAFFKKLKAILERKGIKYGLLPHTKDIWCRDFMPIQISKDRFVQFKYDPKYLKPKKYRAKKTDPSKICEAICIKPIISDIKIDGGNIVQSKTRVIVTERIFSENPRYAKEKLLKEIARLFGIKKVIVIPECPDDLFGHADGVVKFIEVPWAGKDIIYVSDCSECYPEFFSKLLKILLEEKLIPIILPFETAYDKKSINAAGIYVNYMQVGKIVIYPFFGKEADKIAHRKFFSFFGSWAIPIQAGEIAKEGGVLNCVSWNIKTDD